jgi:hypothetical protein
MATRCTTETGLPGPVSFILYKGGQYMGWVQWAYLLSILLGFTLHLVTWYVYTIKTGLSQGLGLGCAVIIYLALLFTMAGSSHNQGILVLYYLALIHIPLVVITLLLRKAGGRPPGEALLGSYLMTGVAASFVLLWAGPMHRLIFWLERQGFDYNQVHPFARTFSYTFFYAFIIFTIIRSFVSVFSRRTASAKK